MGLQRIGHNLATSLITYHFRWLSGEESACNAGNVSLIPWLWRSPGVGNGPIYKGAWRPTVHGVTKGSQMTEHVYTSGVHI